MLPKISAKCKDENKKYQRQGVSNDDKKRQQQIGVSVRLLFSPYHASEIPISPISMPWTRVLDKVWLTATPD
jgi:hypothetical protein